MVVYLSEYIAPEAVAYLKERATVVDNFDAIEELDAIILRNIPVTAEMMDSEFGGADGAAEEAILEIDPDYEPWAESVVELPGGETESLLFCLQAAIGALIIGYGFGYLAARKKYNREAAK